MDGTFGTLNQNTTTENKKKKQATGAKNLVKLTPSQLIKRQLPGHMTEDNNYKPKITQFLNMGDYSINRESAVPIDEPMFEPVPSVIKFIDYEPLLIKTMIFRLRNKDSVARTVKIIQPESRLFQVSPYGAEKGLISGDGSFNAGSKVAPGLEVKYVIKFSPEAKIDYNYNLHIVTEREKFVVPIVAIGKRAMIDFPDTINFGRDCPVKFITEKPVIIRNLGDKTTKWELKLPNGFLADKKEGVLEHDRSEQIILKFYPMEKKLYEAEAMLCYDGMDAYIPITGNAINGNVYLNKQLIKMGKPYIGLETQKTVEIVNKSNVKIDFEWRTFATESEEQEKKEMIKMQLDEEEQEKRIILKEAATLDDHQELLDIQNDDDSDYEEVDEKTMMLTKQRKGELLLQRNFKNIKKAIDENLLLFDHDIFDIKPQTGSIWPNSEMTITVSFRPKAA